MLVMKGNWHDVYVYDTGNEVKYVRKKAPLKPDWQSCFDAHLYPGRALEITVMQGPEKKFGDVTVSAQSLSDHCKSTNDIASVSVNTYVHSRCRCRQMLVSCKIGVRPTPRQTGLLLWIPVHDILVFIRVIEYIRNNNNNNNNNITFV